MYGTCIWDWQQNLTYVWYVAPSTLKSTLTCHYAPPTIYWLKGKRGLTFVYIKNILGLVTGVNISAFLELMLPLIDYLSNVSMAVMKRGRFRVPGNHKFREIICLGEWHGRMKRSEEFTTFWSDFICKTVKGIKKNIIICLKMRQDYLSTCYLDQFISASFHYDPLCDLCYTVNGTFMVFTMDIPLWVVLLYVSSTAAV